jgi:ligand-binding SRPBCC domain-containing protein
MRFLKVLDVDAPVSALWDFHASPRAFELLLDPADRQEVLELPRSLEVGARARVRVWIGPLPVLVEAEHIAYEPGRRFTDRMLRGPFKRWVHDHRFEERPGGGARLIDDVEYELPGGALGRLLGGGYVRRRLERLFEHRHRVTAASLGVERSPAP